MLPKHHWDNFIVDLGCGGSVQFSCSVVSNFFWPHELQHTRLPCLSPTPRAYINSCPSRQWHHPTISLILCCPLLPPSIFPSNRVFSNKSALHIRWSNYWSFSFSISPSNEYSGLISFRMDWLDPFAVQWRCKDGKKTARCGGRSLEMGHMFLWWVPSHTSTRNTSPKVFIIVWGLTEHSGYPVLIIIKQYLLTTKPLMTEEWFTAQHSPG